MIIIVEGPDNAGKSTLCNKLSKDLGLPIVHPGGPPKDTISIISRCLEQDASFTLANYFSFIYDRVTCISDDAYNYNVNNHQGLAYFRSSLRNAKVLVIYCRPSDDQLKDFSGQMKKDHKSAETAKHAVDNVDIIIARYDYIMNELSDLGVNIERYDFLDSDAEYNYTSILDNIKKA